MGIHVSKLGGKYGQPGFNIFYVGRQYITQIIGNHCTVQTPKKNITGLRAKQFFNPQKIQECHQKPLFQYSEYLLVALSFSCVLSNFISIGSSFLF